jgi:diguanylate cyclase (GGDEF)-like protein
MGTVLNDPEHPMITHLARRSARDRAAVPAHTADALMGAQKMVGIFSTPGEHDKLRAAVSQLPFSVLPCEPAREDNRDPLAAAIVTDSIGQPLELCAKLSRACPTILVTANVDFEFRLAAARAGVGAVLFRPLDPNELVDWLEFLTGLQRNAPFSILVVDDDRLLGEVYAEALRGAGMCADLVDRVTDAFDRINASVPDLILLDVRMPGVDGIELARMIRQSRRYLAIPIVFVSSERDMDLQMQARRFGGDEFIAKPVDLDRLVDLVRLRAERAHVMRSAMERDGLTGLLNHSRFKDRLLHELERSRRTGAEVSFALLDLDGFKQVNDTHGHLIGDRVIRALSASLTSGLRKIDIIGRYGGEEFGVIMLDTSPYAARAAIDKQRERFCAIEFEVSGHRFATSFSAGIAGSRTHSGVEQLIAAADRALYAAKDAGRNRVAVDGA